MDLPFLQRMEVMTGGDDATHISGGDDHHAGDIGKLVNDDIDQ